MVGSVLFVEHFGGALGDVVGTSGLLATEGSRSLLGMWLLDAIIALGAAGILSTLLDRVDRTRLVRRIVLGSAGLAVLYAALLGFGPPSAAAFLIIAVGQRVQNCVIYYAAWALARDAFGDSVTALARLRVIATAGQLAGALVAAALGGLGVPQAALFVSVAALFFVVERILARGHAVRAIESARTHGAVVSLPPSQPAFASLRPTEPPHFEESVAPPRAAGLRRVLAYLKESRQVRSLMLLGISNGVGYSVLAFVLARVFDASHGDIDALQTKYGVLRALEPLAYAATELVVAPFVIKRAGVARAMAATPVVLLLGVAALLAWPTAVVGIAASSALQASFAVEAPALSSAIGSLPARLRARIGVLLDSTPYTVGYIVAVGILGASLVIEHALALTPLAARALTCGVGIVTSVAGVFAIRRVLLAQREARAEGADEAAVRIAKNDPPMRG